MGSLKAGLTALKNKEVAVIQSERFHWVHAKVAEYRANQQLSEDSDRPLQKQIKAMLEHHKNLPWYKRWWHRRANNRLQVAYAHLKAEAAIGQLLAQLDDHDNLPFTDTSPVQFFRAAKVVATLRHQDSFWQIPSWWNKKRLEKQLTQAGTQMQRHLENQQQLLLQWQVFCRELRSEACWLISDLTKDVAQTKGDFFEQIEKNIDLDPFYIEWAEQSWLEKPADACPGWLGRQNRTVSNLELYAYVRQLARLLELVNKSMGLFEPREQPLVESTENQSTYLLHLLASLLRQGLYLAQAQQPVSGHHINPNAAKVWSLYQKLNRRIVQLADKALQKQLPLQGITKWWQIVAAEFPQSAIKNKTSFWRRLLRNEQKRIEHPKSLQSGWVQTLESRLQQEECHHNWLLYQEELKKIEADYQAQNQAIAEESDVLITSVRQRFESYKLKLSALITVGIAAEPEPEQLELMFIELKQSTALLAEAIAAFWEHHPEYIQVSSNKKDKEKESVNSEPVLEDIEDEQAKTEEIWIQLGIQGLNYCQDLGLKPDREGKIAWSVVKKTYHQLARKTHADRNEGIASDAFIKVNTAYQFIEGIKNGNQDLGYCGEGQSEAFQAEAEMMSRTLVKIRQEMEELSVGWQDVNRRLDAAIVRNEEIAEGFAEIRQGFQNTREGFQDIREGFQEVREGFQETREGFQKVREGFQVMDEYEKKIREIQERMDRKLEIILKQKQQEKEAFKERGGTKRLQGNAGFWQRRENPTTQNEKLPLSSVTVPKKDNEADLNQEPVISNSNKTENSNPKKILIRLGEEGRILCEQLSFTLEASHLLSLFELQNQCYTLSNSDVLLDDETGLTNINKMNTFIEKLIAGEASYGCCLDTECDKELMQELHVLQEMLSLTFNSSKEVKEAHSEETSVNKSM